MKNLIVLIAASLSLNSFSQQNFVPGYMINDKGDTLKGEVKINPKKEADAFFRLTFKDASGAQKNWKPNKIKGYGMQDKHFVSVVDKEESFFYQRLTNGAILLYKSAFEVESAAGTSKEFVWYLFKDGDKKMTEVKENKFKKQIQEWMSGNAGFANDYEEGKEFNEASAIDIVNKYNEWKKAN